MGAIQQNAVISKNDAFQNYLNAVENKRLRNEEKSYQQGLINDQRTYEQNMYDKQYKDAQSTQRVSMVQESIYNEYANILNSVSSNNKVDTEVVKKKLMDVAGKYGQYLNPDDLANIELYIDTLLTSVTVGTGAANDHIIQQNIKTDERKEEGEKTALQKWLQALTNMG